MKFKAKAKDCQLSVNADAIAWADREVFKTYEG